MNWCKLVSVRSAAMRGGWGGYVKASLYEIRITNSGKMIWNYANEDTDQTTSVKKITKLGTHLAEKHDCPFHMNLGSLHNVEVSGTNLEMLAQLTLLKEKYGRTNETSESS